MPSCIFVLLHGGAIPAGLSCCSACSHLRAGGQVCAADTQRLLGCAEDCNDVSQATVGTPKGAGIGNDAEVI